MTNIFTELKAKWEAADSHLSEGGKFWFFRSEADDELATFARNNVPVMLAEVERIRTFADAQKMQRKLAEARLEKAERALREARGVLSAL